MVRPAGLDHGPPRPRGDAGPLEQGGFARFCGASERVEIGARCLPGAHHNATRDDDIAHTAPVAGPHQLHDRILGTGDPLRAARRPSIRSFAR